jgi:hypothetical protein
MITRRAVLGVGATVASTACMTGFKAYAATPGVRAQPIDALLVDKNVHMPRQIAAYISARSKILPVATITLDAAGHSELMRLLNNSQAIIGISSGATLFCVERLAWDHGYRLTGRSQQCLSAINDQSCQQDVAAFLIAAHSPTVPTSSETCAYRPSHADDTLHAWIMQKSAGARLLQTRREA